MYENPTPSNILLIKVKSTLKSSLRFHLLNFLGLSGPETEHNKEERCVSGTHYYSTKSNDIERGQWKII